METFRKIVSKLDMPLRGNILANTQRQKGLMETMDSLRLGCIYGTCCVAYSQAATIPAHLWKDEIQIAMSVGCAIESILIARDQKLDSAQAALATLTQYAA